MITINNPICYWLKILTKNFNCSCVIEPAQTALDYKETMQPGDDNKKTFVQQISLRDEIELDSLNELSKNLKLNQQLKTVNTNLFHIRNGILF